MIFNELKNTLLNLKTKLYYKTFKKPKTWDENFLKFVVDSVVSPLNWFKNDFIELTPINFLE